MKKRGMTFLVLIGLIAGCTDSKPVEDRNSYSTQAETIPNQSVTQEELIAQLQSTSVPVLLDVRTSLEFDRGHIEGAILIPHSQLASRLQEVEGYKNQQVVVYCESGVRARNAANTLKNSGFTRVTLLEGDMAMWRANDRAVEQN